MVVEDSSREGESMVQGVMCPLWGGGGGYVVQVGGTDPCGG